jgi:hypothetical protein
MTTRPGFVWDATASEWVNIGQAAVLAPVSYQATAPTSPATGDIWIESDVDVPSIDSSQFLRWRKTMTGGETSLSGNDDLSLPLQYTPGYEQLYINGVLQVRGQDYTATTGTTVTGLTALVANDVVEIFSAVARTVADVYTQTQSDARFVNRNVGGLNLVIPTGATNGTVSANGAVTIGSAVNSVTVNGAFSSAYDNYKIIISGGAASTFDNISMTLGSANTEYYTSVMFTNFSGAGWNTFSSNNAANFPYIGYASPNGIRIDADILNPFTAHHTSFQGNYTSLTAAGLVAGLQKSTTSFTGFTIGFSGTLTGGTIRIYGYNNGA